MTIRDELIRLAEAWVDAERDELLDTPIKAAKAAFLSYVDTLQPDGRRCLLCRGTGMVPGSSNEQCLNCNGTGALQSDTATSAASPRKDPTALTPQTTGEG